MQRIGLITALLLGAASVSPAQIVVTSPASGTTTVGPADDFATRAFQDPWDMGEYSDLGWFTFGADQPPINLSGLSVTGGVFSGTPTNGDPNFWLLDTWLPGSAVLGKIGKRFPIDASNYRVLVMRMRLSERPAGDQAMQILWSNNTIYGSEPGGGFRVANSVLTYDGWQFYIVDLVTLGSAVGPAWSGSVDALRIDPTQYQVGQIQLDWARLVPRDDANLLRTVEWTGSQVVDIHLDDDATAANGTLGQVAHSHDGGGAGTKSYGLYVGGLEPGDYYVAMRAAGTGDPLVYSPGRYRVLGAPTLRLTSPSEEGSDDDFATVQLNDAWDMDSTDDVDRTTGLTGLSAGSVAATNEAGASLGTVPVIQGTSVAAAGVGDPAVYWMWSTERGLNHRIDTDRYRVLTFELNMPGPRDVLDGSIARVVWKLADESVENVSEDIVINHRSGANVFAKVIADMETLELESLPGGSPSTTGWANGGDGGLDNFRIDPHEFSPATGFAYRRVKLAAFERAGSSYTIEWSFSNPSSMTTTLKLVADLDQTGCNGITIATGLDPSSGSYDWTVPVSFNDGESRYVCAQVLSGPTVINESYSRWPIVREVGYTGALPRLVPERGTLRFGAVNNGGTLTAVTPGQELVVTQVGSGTVNWSASSNQSWVTVTPGATSGTDVLTVGIANPGGILPATGFLHATVQISSTDIENSPQWVDVYLDIQAPGASAPPFGTVDTPAHGSTGVVGAVPVTGWALDDVGIDRVEVWRDPVAGLEVSGSPNGKIFIGNAILTAGARPDVEALYEDSMPRAQLAGWGYMLLTNFLPDRVAIPNETSGGNGTFVLHAYAVDEEGQTILLGSKTITCDNDNSTKPFGTIDTPAQGGTASGGAFVNFGWALTPLPATIPTNGSTMVVYVDGVPLGSPTYNQYRADIATLFPGLNNSNGAVGYSFIDTTTYANGVHTIAWSVTDDLGRGEGIGSRYFSVVNGAADFLADGATVEYGDLEQEYGPELGRALPSLPHAPTPPRSVIAHALDPVEVLLERSGAEPGKGTTGAFFLSGDRLRRLPSGARFDAEQGRFTWTPGPGFVGEYRFVFVSRDGRGGVTARPLTIELRPRPL